MIRHLLQECELESNPIWFASSYLEEVENFRHAFLKRAKMKPAKRNSLLTLPNVLRTKAENIFYEDIIRKAESSILDTAILKSEDDLDVFVHLFEGQTILRNSVFFDLFQHWFESSSRSPYIDKLLYQMKQKADLLHRGPTSFTKKEKIGLLFRYEYLRKILQKAKSKIQDSKGNGQTKREWKKFIGFLSGHRYFQVTKDTAYTRERAKGLDPINFIGGRWFKNNIIILFELAKYDLKEEEYFGYMKTEEEAVRAKGVPEGDIKIFMDNLTKKDTIFTIRNGTPSELSIFLVAELSGSTKRQVRRVIESNHKMLGQISNILTRIPSLN